MMAEPAQIAGFGQITLMATLNITTPSLLPEQVLVNPATLDAVRQSLVWRLSFPCDAPATRGLKLISSSGFEMPWTAGACYLGNC